MGAPAPRVLGVWPRAVFEWGALDVRRDERRQQPATLADLILVAPWLRRPAADVQRARW
jgi:hypothetical protein